MQRAFMVIRQLEHSRGKWFRGTFSGIRQHQESLAQHPCHQWNLVPELLTLLQTHVAPQMYLRVKVPRVEFLPESVSWPCCYN